MRPFVRTLSTFLALAILVFSPLAAQAAQPFSAKGFEAAQAAGKTVLIDVWASWCPTCRKQQSVIEEIARERPNLVVYRVDFDSQKDVLRRFKAQQQATLIMFKGKAEVGRLVYDANPANIRRLVAKGF
jgi:thioredoxin 1